jgi:hypothetical protein
MVQGIKKDLRNYTVQRRGRGLLTISAKTPTGVLPELISKRDWADQRMTMNDKREFDHAPARPATRTERAVFAYFIFIAIVAAATLSFAAVSFAISA